jgi:3-deoxy-D-manno-octulosonic-acid transferase
LYSIYSYFVNLAYWIFYIIPVGNLKKKKKLRNYRKESWAKLSALNKFGQGKSEYICFHCASVGEYEQSKPLIKYVEQRTNLSIAVSFFSPSGYEEVKLGPKYLKLMLPKDTCKAQQKWIEFLNVKAFVLCKYEIHPVLIAELKKRNIPVILFSAIFREKQVYFKWYGHIFRSALKKLDMVFVQDNHSIQLLSEIGIKRVTKAGDTRLDRVAEALNVDYQDDILDRFLDANYDRQIWVAGSTWPTDDCWLEQCLEKANQIAVVHVPHEVHTERTDQILNRFRRFGTVRYSDNPKMSRKTRCLILDKIGVLKYVYRLGDVAYIGNGFGKSGIHNTMEAAVYGKPVVFGPNHKKFMEAVELLKRGGAFTFKTKEELDGITYKLIQEYQLKDIARINKNFVTSNSGATEKIGRILLENFIHPNDRKEYK